MSASRNYLFGFESDDVESNVDADELIHDDIYDGGTQVRRIPCHMIKTNGLCFRDEREWNSDEFRKLKGDISRDSENLEPITVRRLDPGEGGDGEHEYALVSGLRRYMACKELGIRAVAFVMYGDAGRCAKLATKNAVFCKKLSPYEISVIAHRMRSLKIAKTAKEISRYIGVSPSNMAKIMIIYELPQLIKDCFLDKRKIQVAWGYRLRNALLVNHDGVIECARNIVRTGCHGKPIDIFNKLILSAGMSAKQNKNETVFVKDGVTVVEILEGTDEHGRTLLAIDSCALSVMDLVARILNDNGAKIVTRQISGREAGDI